jgi:hypothetical protein
MSHIIKLNLELKVKAAVIAACKRLGIACTEGQHSLFGSQSAKGLGFTLPGWRYPIVIAEDGNISYDAYGSSLSKPVDEYFGEFRAAYGVEKTKAEALANGYEIFENFNPITQEDELTLVQQEGYDA